MTKLVANIERTSECLAITLFWEIIVDSGAQKRALETPVAKFDATNRKEKLPKDDADSTCNKLSVSANWEPAVDTGPRVARP
jgi:hypothetical protein